MTDHNERMVRDTPCAACGCYAAKHFKCFCGAVHSDHCVNCGRFVDANSPAVLGTHDRRCKHGAVSHDHPWVEKEPYKEAVSEAFRRCETEAELVAKLKEITESSDEVITEEAREFFALKAQLYGGAN